MLRDISSAAIVLVFIVFILIGILRDCIKEICLNSKERLPMKTKMKKFLVAFVSVLNSVWTMSTNFVAGAMLT